MSSTRTPFSMKPPSTKPFSSVRLPTCAFSDRLWPGSTTTPRMRSAKRWMLVTRDWQHACLVVKVPTSSTMPSDSRYACSSRLTAGRELNAIGPSKRDCNASAIRSPTSSAQQASLPSLATTAGTPLTTDMAAVVNGADCAAKISSRYGPMPSLLKLITGGDALASKLSQPAIVSRVKSCRWSSYDTTRPRPYRS